jgi:3-deoxy-7-phosphoheptulonate synthase
MTRLVDTPTNEASSTRAVSITDTLSCGNDTLWLIAGPCSIESREQLDSIATTLVDCGVHSLRGGAFKPRTSPYSFQGLGEDGLLVMSEVADAHNLCTVTEVMSETQIPMVARYADVLQVGSRNMQNFDLLKALGKLDKPILLKRGLAATLDEFLWAAEYIVAQGNPRVILCERGIRSYCPETRNVLDLGGVAVLKAKTHLPVIVDPSHAAGRRDIIEALSKAAIAVGADGLIIETHPMPEASVSDADQALSLEAYRQLIHAITPVAHAVGRAMPSFNPQQRQPKKSAAYSQ